MDVATGGTKKQRDQSHDPSDETRWNSRIGPVKRTEQPKPLIEKVICVSHCGTFDLVPMNISWKQANVCNSYDWTLIPKFDR